METDGEEEDEEEEDDNDDDDKECLPLADDSVEGVSPATRAKQLAVRLKQAARKVLRDLGRILAISLLALAGKSAHCPLQGGTNCSLMKPFHLAAKLQKW